MMKKLALAALLTLGFGTASAAAPLLITGAGATFPFPLYSKWFSEYNKLHPDIRFNYQSIGSGGGIQQFTDRHRRLRRHRRAHDRRASWPRPRTPCTSRPCSARWW